MTVRRLIEQLLTDVGKAHPQALIYPLTVASKSQVAARRDTAHNIMAKMREHSAVMVDQVRVAALELEVIADNSNTNH
jgi:FKBP12-rapamycin complex-associated protein